MSGESRESRASGITYIVLTLVGWSSVLLFLKHLTPYIDAWTANGWRYGLSALLWLPVLVVGARSGTLPEGIWRRALVPALFNCMAQVCFAQAPYYIGPGLAGFLLRINIVFSTAGALILFADERPLARSPYFWGGLALVVVGSIGTVLLGSTPLVGGTATGVILGLGAGAFYGLYGVSVRYWMHGVRPMVSFAAISLYTAIVMVSLMIGLAESHGAAAFDLSVFNWMMLILSALIGIALGHLFYYSAIARLGVAISAAVVQLAPFITGVASVLIFGEVLTHWQWICGVIMVFGAGSLFHSERSRLTAARAPPSDISEQDASESAGRDANGACAATRVP